MLGGWAVTAKEYKGAAGRRFTLYLANEVIAATLRGSRRLLLFIGLDKQADDANDQNANLNEIGISNHRAAPLSQRTGGKKLRPLKQGANRLPLLAAPWMISQVAKEGKLWYHKNR